jgi:RNA polymerase sigma-70 factor, ECF subfamily
MSSTPRLRLNDVSASQARATAPRADDVATAALDGHEPAFAALFEQHRRELQVHCYRMLGSLDDAEDLVQETFLRAWRKRASFRGQSSFRAWLYRIATNACLDALEKRRRVASAATGSAAEVPWLQPYPDHLLEGIASSEDEPDAAAIEKETIELAYLVAIQHLPPRQRAVLILRDVLGWSARETAELLDTSVASANSALQRARSTMKTHLPARRSEWRADAEASTAERAVLDRYVEATERSDAGAIAALMREDARFTMPPQPQLVEGRDAIVQAWLEGGFGTEGFGDMRCVVTSVNRQPAVAVYLRRPGDTRHRALAVDVLRIEEGTVVEITAFGDGVFPSLGLPPTLER